MRSMIRGCIHVTYGDALPTNAMGKLTDWQ